MKNEKSYAGEGGERGAESPVKNVLVEHMHNVKGFGV